MKFIKIRNNIVNELIQKIGSLVIGFLIGKLVMHFNPEMIYAPIQGASVVFGLLFLARFYVLFDIFFEKQLLTRGMFAGFPLTFFNIESVIADESTPLMIKLSSLNNIQLLGIFSLLILFHTMSQFREVKTSKK